MRTYVRALQHHGNGAVEIKKTRFGVLRTCRLGVARGCRKKAVPYMGCRNVKLKRGSYSRVSNWLQTNMAAGREMRDKGRHPGRDGGVGGRYGTGGITPGETGACGFS